MNTITSRQGPLEPVVGRTPRLSDMLRQAREARGWTLQEAAEMLGSSKAHLHSMENGTAANPTLRTLAAVVVVYGLRPEALISTAIATRQDVEPFTRRYGGFAVFRAFKIGG